MTKELEERADTIATACNKVIEELGFDINTDGVGFDENGNFYSLVGDDMHIGLRDFFAFAKSENYNKPDILKQIRNDYYEYNAMKRIKEKKDEFGMGYNQCNTH